MNAFFDPGLSTTENLAANGLTHRRIGASYRHEVLCGRKVIFRGDAADVTAWLRELAGLPQPRPSPALHSSSSSASIRSPSA